MVMEGFHMEWNASLYDQKHDFVAEYGSDLLQFIPQNAEQSILDLGCGTGALTERLAGLGRRVLGADSSPEMIESARAQHPELEFVRCDALKGLVSKESPVGKAILGRKVGDTVTVRVSNTNSYHAEILSIEKQADDGSAPLRSF